MLSTRRTFNIIIINILLHLFIRPAINTSICFYPVFFHIIFNKVICTETLMAFFAIHKRVWKAAQMPWSNPCLWVHKNSTVNTSIILIFTHKLLPPCLFYIILKFYTKISIIPCICKPAIYFWTWVYKAPCLW